MAAVWFVLFVVSLSVIGVETGEECVSRQELSEVERKVSDLTARLQEVEHKQVATDLPNVAGGISFAATLTKSKQIKGNESILFDKVLLDTFGSYSTRTGIFTIPDYGVYYFSATTRADQTTALGTGIVRNGNFVARMMSDSKNGDGQGSTSLTMNLYPGDRIWVSTDQDASGQLKNESGWNVFTGFQLNSSI